MLCIKSLKIENKEVRLPKQITTLRVKSYSIPHPH